MADLQFPSWEGPLRAAQIENDIDKLIEKIYAAEEAMLARWQELAKSSNGHHELVAMQYAVKELMRIKTEKLHWPRVR